MPVGVNPAENPCANRRNKNPPTKLKIGYNKPTIKHTEAPKIITGILPILSASLPEKGLERPADKVNNEMIKPL